MANMTRRGTLRGSGAADSRRLVASERELAVLKRRLADLDRENAALRAESRLGGLSVLQNALSAVLVVVDPLDAVLLWNATAEQTFGNPAANVIGHRYDACGVSWDRATLRANVAAARRASTPTRLPETPYVRRDGSLGLLGITLNPVVDERGPTGGFLLLGSDITEHKALEHRHEVAKRMEAMGELAAGIAHEVNSPIQWVTSNTSFLQEAFEQLVGLARGFETALAEVPTEVLGPDARRRLAECREAADLDFLVDEIPGAIEQSLDGLRRVTEIVRAMKSVSHPGAGAKAATDVNKVVRDAVTLTRNSWKYCAEVELDLEPELPALDAFEGPLCQTIVNLVVNAGHAVAAARARDEDALGRIRLVTRALERGIEIRVSDTGCGIPAEVQPRVFHPFFTTKAVGVGTGQGLAIAHTVVVEQHGGVIAFETEQGRGTTVIVRLPLG